MYKIVSEKTGQTIGYTDNPRWIKVNNNGIYVHASREEAQGIAYNSTAYSLLWADIPNTEKVLIHEEDTGKLFEQLKANQDFIAIMSDIELN